MRLSLAAGALALFFVGSLVPSRATAIPVNHHGHATFAPLTADRTSPDVTQWMTGRLIVKHTRHAAAINRFARSVLARVSLIAQRLTRSALRFIGVPYVFGGTSAMGFDCSGYVQHVFAMHGISIPRTADAQYYAGARVRYPRPGDLVFFQTYEEGPSHVGIYLGHDHFIHASSSRGVMISSLSDSYWSVRYLGAKSFISTHSTH